MGMLVIAGIAVVVVVALAIAASISKKRSSNDLGLSVDVAAKPWLRSMPLEFYRGWPEIEIEWAMAGTRNARRVWLFEVELERPGNVEREYTAVVYEVAGVRPPLDLARPASVEHIEVIEGHIVVFLEELPWKRLAEALRAADQVLAQVTPQPTT